MGLTPEDLNLENNSYTPLELIWLREELIKIEERVRSGEFEHSNIDFDASYASINRMLLARDRCLTCGQQYTHPNTNGECYILTNPGHREG